MSKINLHIIENCNFSCKYCFAHFRQDTLLRKSEWIRIIDNCINSKMIDEINFAGGEPLIHPDFMDIVKYAIDRGVVCSFITNGSLLNEEWIAKNGGYFNTVGISVDSVKESTMKEIGRCDKSGNYMSKSRLKKILDWFYQYHSNVKIKINTTVNRYNKDETFADCLMTAKNVKRWKMLKMCPFENDTFSNKELMITAEQYNEYVKRNLSAMNIQYVENNILYKLEHMEIVAETDMKGAYYMVDAGGYLVDNTTNDNYKRLINCMEEPLIEGINQLNFNFELYSSRYQNPIEKSKGFSIGDKVCYEGSYGDEEVCTGIVEKIVEEDFPAYFKDIDADKQFNKVLYGIRPDDRMAICNYEGLYYSVDYLTGATEQEVKDNIARMFKRRKERYMKETKTLTDLVRFLMLNDIHSEDCDFIAREVAYIRCEEFGIDIK